MRTPTDLARRCCAAALLVFFAIGAGACVTIEIDDLRFESLRRVGVDERMTYPASLRNYMNNVGYPDSEILEATLSTERDLVRLMQRDDGWMLSARVWRCGTDRVDESVRRWPDLYYQRHVVGSLRAYAPDGEVAKPEDSRSNNGRYFYTLYLRVRDVERPNWPAPAYDLSAAPFDVCVYIGAAAYMRAISIESNVAVIPKAAFDAFVEHR